MSPRSGIHDPFDLEQFNFDDFSPGAQMSGSTHSSPAKRGPGSTTSSQGYQREYVPGMSPQPQRSASAYGGLNIQVGGGASAATQQASSTMPQQQQSLQHDSLYGLDRPSSAGPFGVRQDTAAATRTTAPLVSSTLPRTQSPYDRTSTTSRTQASPYGGISRDMQLSPSAGLADRAATLGRKSPALSYGTPKDEPVSKPFAQPEYPA